MLLDEGAVASSQPCLDRLSLNNGEEQGNWENRAARRARISSKACWNGFMATK